MTLRWSDPEERAVVEDHLLERAKARPPLPPYENNDGYGDGDGDGDGDGGYGGDGGDGDGGGGGYGGGGGDGDGGGDGGDGDGYGYGYDGGGGGGGVNGKRKEWASIMKEGLHIVVSPGGYTPYVRIAWCRRLEGDEWELVGARIIRRYGRDQQLVNLAAKGPAKPTDKGADDGTKLLDAATVPSPIHRLHAIRIEPANEEAWREHCPKPAGWGERGTEVRT
jgi:hypothetical protein